MHVFNTPDKTLTSILNPSCSVSIRNGTSIFGRMSTIESSEEESFVSAHGIRGIQSLGDRPHCCVSGVIKQTVIVASCGSTKWLRVWPETERQRRVGDVFQVVPGTYFLQVGSTSFYLPTAK